MKHLIKESNQVHGKTAGYMVNSEKKCHAGSSFKKSISFMPAFILLFSWLLAFELHAQDRAYNNYDFVAGETLLFSDNFADSRDGEFPPRYHLVNGQGVVNKVDGEPAFIFSEVHVGNMGRIAPRIKTASYLGNAFSIEADFQLPAEEMVAIYFKDAEGDDGRFISVEGDGTVRAMYFPDIEPKGAFPGGESVTQGWHHLAIAYKDRQMKIYIDQYRVLVIPDIRFQPVSMQFGGSQNVKLKNLKVNAGSGMHMLDKIITDGKFVSHAIHFDVNKAVVKGESMGFINLLAKWLKDNPTVKLQIDGHTDSDGDDAANMKLSQQRADAVKSLLVSLGIDSGRLTAKGFGETKPIDNNTTPEGKANNRRVEFVKL